MRIESRGLLKMFRATDKTPGNALPAALSQPLGFPRPRLPPSGLRVRTTLTAGECSSPGDRRSVATELR
jgi:hypothetical protein